MTEERERPKVGIGVMIFRNGQILLGKRKGTHGAGEYAFPGGRLEQMESLLGCAVRETREESAIEIQNIKLQFIANVKKYNSKHWVHIGFTADWKSGEPRVCEPEKCEGWGWYSLDELPKPLFYMTELAVESHKTGQTFFDA